MRKSWFILGENIKIIDLDLDIWFIGQIDLQFIYLFGVKLALKSSFLCILLKKLNLILGKGCKSARPGKCKSTPDLASQLQRQNDLLVVILLCLCCCMLTANESILLIYLLLMIIFEIIIDNNIMIIIINILWINIEY